jgi:hypothetical protein
VRADTELAALVARQRAHEQVAEMYKIASRALKRQNAELEARVAQLTAMVIDVQGKLIDRSTELFAALEEIASLRDRRPSPTPTTGA